ncbi:uncharacterized protein TOT_020000388 [Theileria orientalis strain Shintoku]|uniref:Ubiquitin-like domain-containing protein n=1 Tax=Theileria orientalis strain Shintoku TaxID=869250 RepID=J4D7D9_THEOR|nr:uncharacterized protein TOT_020000388 [Theileria orientalis strain Shintoku]BAM40125.1 uncharacterized protein TOT_020000388 [Theileria orientalis strain Shintoku]|eukprot:XP_009690426.1 uncharacterized protein TOT_020000388 [Theileria orientalis strain Shintoku]
MVKLAIFDYVTSVTGNRIYLNVLKDENIKEVKEKLLLQVKNNLDNKDTKTKIKKVKRKNSVKSEMTAESLILYLGAIILDDEKSIEDYNGSDLPELSLSLYSRVDIKVVVTTLKGIRCFGINYTPIFSFIFKKKIAFKMIDQQTVLEIKKKILSQYQFSNKKGETIKIEDLNLIHDGYELSDNLCQINEMNFKDDMKITLIVPYGYAMKKL